MPPRPRPREFLTRKLYNKIVLKSLCLTIFFISILNLKRPNWSKFAALPLYHFCLKIFNVQTNHLFLQFYNSIDVGFFTL